MDRKKRKFGQIGDAGAASDTSAAKPTPTVLQASVEAADQSTAAKAKEISNKSPKPSVKAKKKARNGTDVSKTAANPKQQLLRTVALGNLQAEYKAEAVAMARAAGKVLTQNVSKLSSHRRHQLHAQPVLQAMLTMVAGGGHCGSSNGCCHHSCQAEAGWVLRANHLCGV